MSKRDQSSIPESAKPFNPLAKSQLARSVAEALLLADINPLPPTARFPGSGVYVIYYIGKLPEYSHLAKIGPTSNSAAPIYVGKAIPSGARKGRQEFDTAVGFSLFNRLNEHAESIAKASNLELIEFQCRYLVVDDIWIPLAESLLINEYKPIWNVLIDGFGNHDPGAGRRQQQKSPWDVLHPGRTWAEKQQPHAKTRDVIALAITSHLLKNKKD